MLVTREELRFDFKGARWDLTRLEDRRLLGWIFNQFLYGEVTGIQCGHWLYHAPHLNAAAFLAKQAGEELSHVRKILRILTLLGERPREAHWAIRFLSTGMMGKSWGEHVALEMALGEGLVLGVFYAMTDTIQDPEIHRILEQASTEEERHCEFGERETREWLARHPESRQRLLAQAMIQVWALSKIRGFVIRKLLQNNADHPVLSRFGEFYDHSIRCLEMRIERLGLSSKPITGYSLAEKWWLLVSLPFRQLKARLTSRKPLLTSTYLTDPVLVAEEQRSHPS